MSHCNTQGSFTVPESCSFEQETPGLWTKIKPELAPGDVTTTCPSVVLEEDGSLFTLMSCHIHVKGRQEEEGLARDTSASGYSQAPVPQTEMYRGDDERPTRSPSPGPAPVPKEPPAPGAPAPGPKPHHSCEHADASTRCSALARGMPGFAVQVRDRGGRRHKTLLSPCWKQVEWGVWDLLFPRRDGIRGVQVRIRGASALQIDCDVSVDFPGPEPPRLVGQRECDWETLVQAYLAVNPGVPLTLVAARRHERRPSRDSSEEPV